MPENSGAVSESSKTSQEKTPVPKVRTITLPGSPIGADRKLTDETKTQLEQITGNPIQRIGGGTSKETFADDSHTEVFHIFKTSTSPVIAEQVTEQIDFYQERVDDDAFTAIAVPMTGIILDTTEAPIGMSQPFYGVALNEFTAQGGRLTASQIDTFVTNYQKFIDATGIVHGDFAYGDNGGRLSANWDSVRIDPRTGALKFIDYNGRNRGIAYGSHRYQAIANPTTPDERADNETYKSLVQSEAERTKATLYQYFNILPEIKHITADTSGKGRFQRLQEFLRGRRKAA